MITLIEAKDQLKYFDGIGMTNYVEPFSAACHTF